MDEDLRALEVAAGLRSLEAAAVRLEVSVGTVKKLGRQGHFPIIRIGPRTLRVPAAALDEYVARAGAAAQAEQMALAARKAVVRRDRAS